MRIRRKSCLFAVAAFTVALSQISILSSESSATQTILPSSIPFVSTSIDGFDGMAIDQENDDLFITTPDSLIEIDTSGAIIATVANIHHPEFPIFCNNELWLTMPDANEVVEYNPATLQIEMTVPVALPRQIVSADNALWVSSETPFPQLIRIDPNTGATSSTGNVLLSQTNTDITTVPNHPDEILNWIEGSPLTVNEINVGGAIPVVTLSVNLASTTPYDFGSASSLPSTPDGSSFIPSGAVSPLMEVTNETLQPNGITFPFYGEQTTADAISPGDGGLLVGGTIGDVVSPLGIQLNLFIYQISQPNQLVYSGFVGTLNEGVQKDGIAISDDGNHLYSVTGGTPTPYGGDLIYQVNTMDLSGLSGTNSSSSGSGGGSSGGGGTSGGSSSGSNPPTSTPPVTPPAALPPVSSPTEPTAPIPSGLVTASSTSAQIAVSPVAKTNGTASDPVTPTATESPTSQTFASLSASQLLKSSANAMKSKSSVTVTGSIDKNTKNAISIEIQSARSSTKVMEKSRTTDISSIEVPSGTYVKASANFWENGLHVSKQKAEKIAVGWIKMPSPAKTSNVLSYSSVVQAITKATGKFTKLPSKSLDGQKVIGVRTSSGTTIWISSSSSHLPVSIVDNSDSLTFTKWNSTSVPVAPEKSSAP